MVVLLFLRRIGPYHHARFQHAAQKFRLITVETRPASQEYPWEFKASGNYVNFAFPESDDRESGLRGQTLTAAVREAFEKYDPSVVVTTGWADPEYHAAVLQASAHNIPLVVISDSRFEDEPRLFLKEWLKKLILKSYSAALVAGTASRKYMVALGFGAAAIYQPWDVVDNGYFERSQFDIPFEDRYFLCISRFIPKKNLPFLIQAFGRYRAEGGTRNLVLLGSGEQEHSLRLQIGDLGLAKAIQIKGFVQYAGLPDYFRKALCLILPSTTDQWGLVVNEAMASSLPVLVSQQCGCVQDLVKNGLTGQSFDPFNTEDLLAMMMVMDSVSLEKWTELGKEAKRTIGQWDLGNFSDGLQKACAHAIEHPSFGTFAILHKMLSR